MTDEKRTDEEEEGTPVVTGAPTARVADSYGFNPHEHKPSQDAWDPDVAEEKQAESGGALPVGEEETSAGTSSLTSPNSEQSSDEKSPSDSDKPAPRTASRTGKAPTGSSTARTTGTDRK